MPKAIPCETCEFNIANLHKRKVTVRNGSGFVIFSPEGAVQYHAIRTENGKCILSQGVVAAAAVPETYPTLATALGECKAPKTENIPLKGILGKIGLSKEISTCPALASVLDNFDAETVTTYFEAVGVGANDSKNMLQ